MPLLAIEVMGLIPCSLKFFQPSACLHSWLVPLATNCIVLLFQTNTNQLKTVNETQNLTVDDFQELLVCTDSSLDVTSSLSPDLPGDRALTESSTSALVFIVTGSLVPCSHDHLPGHSTNLHTLELESLSESNTGLPSLLRLYLTDMLEWASQRPTVSCLPLLM